MYSTARIAVFNKMYNRVYIKVFITLCNTVYRLLYNKCIHYNVQKGAIKFTKVNFCVALMGSYLLLAYKH